jgi:hypothetical protein
LSPDQHGGDAAPQQKNPNRAGFAEPGAYGRQENPKKTKPYRVRTGHECERELQKKPTTCDVA